MTDITRNSGDDSIIRKVQARVGRIQQLSTEPAPTRIGGLLDRSMPAPQDPAPRKSDPSDYAPQRNQPSKETMAFLDEHHRILGALDSANEENRRLSALHAAAAARAESLESLLANERAMFSEQIANEAQHRQRIEAERDLYKARWIRITERARAALRSLQSTFAAAVGTASKELLEVFDEVDSERAFDERTNKHLEGLAKALEDIDQGAADLHRNEPPELA